MVNMLIVKKIFVKLCEVIVEWNWGLLWVIVE